MYHFRVINKKHLNRVLRCTIIFMVDNPCAETISIKGIYVFG